MTTCKVCKGAKKQTLQVQNGLGDGKNREISIACIWCQAKGHMTPVELTAYKANCKLWCACAQPTNVIFYDDGEHPQISKHHYRCEACGKVTQIG